jgi:hypothetical protein
MFDRRQCRGIRPDFVGLLHQTWIEQRGNRSTQQGFSSTGTRHDEPACSTPKSMIAAGFLFYEE